MITWINVHEYLPDSFDDLVLVASKDEIITCYAKYSQADRCWFAENMMILDDVEWWAELPKHPMED